jgi:hypothetical protein
VFDALFHKPIKDFVCVSKLFPIRVRFVPLMKIGDAVNRQAAYTPWKHLCIGLAERCAIWLAVNANTNG